MNMTPEYLRLGNTAKYEGKKTSDMNRKELVTFIGFLDFHLTALTAKYYEETGINPWQVSATEEKSAIILPDNAGEIIHG